MLNRPLTCALYESDAFGNLESRTLNGTVYDPLVDAATNRLLARISHQGSKRKVGGAVLAGGIAR